MEEKRRSPPGSSVNGERRSFALLRPADGEQTSAQEPIREAILEAYPLRGSSLNDSSARRPGGRVQTRRRAAVGRFFN